MDGAICLPGRNSLKFSANNHKIICESRDLTIQTLSSVMVTSSCYRDFSKLPFYTSFQRVILKKIIFTIPSLVLTKLPPLVCLVQESIKHFLLIPRVEVIESRQVLTQKRNLFLPILLVTRAIGSIFVLDELLSKVMDYAIKVTGAERGFLLLRDDEANDLKLRVKRGLEREPPDLLFSYENYRISLELIKSVEKSKTPLIASLEGFPNPKIKVELEKLGVKQAMAVPLMAKDKLSGLIYLDNCLPGLTFGEEELEIMISLALQAGVSIENAKLVETIEQSRNELKWLNKAKDKVLHRLSHELRTPLAVIQGSVRILRRMFQDQSSPFEIEKFFDAIEKHTNRLLDIQQETDAIIRFYPKLNEDWYHEQLNQHFPTTLTSPTPVLLFPLVQRLLERVKQKAKDRQIFFLVEGRKDISVFADPRILEEVLEGLLRNAIENTPDEGMVQVVLEKTGQRGLLRVQDFGIGITEENQKYIFDGSFTPKRLNYTLLKSHTTSMQGVKDLIFFV